MEIITSDSEHLQIANQGRERLTSTPMIYASDIGAEFGISINKTLDLAEFIQNQTDKHLRKIMQYQMHITIIDDMGVSYCHGCSCS